MTDTYLRYNQLIDVMSKLINSSRETVRTPIQWDSSPQDGFSNKTKNMVTGEL